MKVLSVCNYPGSVNALLPVLNALGKSNNSVYVITSHYNHTKFKRTRFKARYLDAPISLELSFEVLNTFKPNILLAGTSEPEDQEVGRVESIFINAAKKNSIPSVAILDFWSKYRERFSLSSENALDALPNKICVMDEKAKNEMIIKGFSEELIIVTGNPHWDKFRLIRKRLDKINLEQIKKTKGIKKNQRIMLFISQPLSERDNDKLGYTELDVLKDIIKLIKQDPTLQDVELWIKPHPRDTISKYDSLMSKKNQCQLHLITDEIDIYTLGLVADFIVGIFSMLLVEYALLGMDVVSYQPVKSTKNLITLGGRIPLVRKLRELKENLFIQQSKSVSMSMDFNATDKVLDIIYETSLDESNHRPLYNNLI